ncbi:hypothetical protein HGRIS_005572 [Hohenbuehelia grisea]|uniref:Uncharacterized protein n=1 Tax=Hohenbuehelia grisea TaxID=104357 RepID=A0ABR3JY46_9AGAR
MFGINCAMRPVFNTNSPIHSLEAATAVELADEGLPSMFEFPRYPAAFLAAAGSVPQVQAQFNGVRYNWRPCCLSGGHPEIAPSGRKFTKHSRTLFRAKYITARYIFR